MTSVALALAETLCGRARDLSYGLCLPDLLVQHMEATVKPQP